MDEQPNRQCFSQVLDCDEWSESEWKAGGTDELNQTCLCSVFVSSSLWSLRDWRHDSSLSACLWLSYQWCEERLKLHHHSKLGHALSLSTSRSHGVTWSVGSVQVTLRRPPSAERCESSAQLLTCFSVLSVLWKHSWACCSDINRNSHHHRRLLLLLQHPSAPPDLHLPGFQDSVDWTCTG